MLALPFVGVSLATDRPLYTIYTASAKGTYYQFGLDIQRACPHLKIQVINTHGSLDNVNNLIQPSVMRTGHQFALVQNDALAAMTEDEPRLKALITPAMRMYSEEITVLVSKSSNIQSLSDLAGKRVAVGVVGSGTWFSAAAIKSQLGITWASIEIPAEESLLGVLSGDIDALITVSGHPVKFFSELGASMKGHVKLLNMSGVELDQMYKTAVLPKNTYLWQDRAVELRSTRSTMITPSSTPESATRALIQCISSKQEELRAWGHPKWRTMQFPAVSTKTK